MSDLQLVALGGFAGAAVAALLITQSKHRVAWPAWLVPVAVLGLWLAWTLIAAVREGPFAFALFTQSMWGVQVWLHLLASVMVAFFLLQNRARAAGLKSEVWVLAVIFTGAAGLLVMLARTLYLERRQAGTPVDGPAGASLQR